MARLTEGRTSFIIAYRLSKGRLQYSVLARPVTAKYLPQFLYTRIRISRLTHARR